MKELLFFIGGYGTVVCTEFSEHYASGQIIFSEDEILNREYYVGAIAECVTPDTEVLVTLDGDTILAKDLKEGDNIVYYNLETDKVEIGKVAKKFIHPDATNFVRYEFEDKTYVEMTDYHPIYTKTGWKSLTQQYGYEKPEIGDEVKTPTGWKKISKIDTWIGLEDCYDFNVITSEGKYAYNYYANGTLVQGTK